MARIRLDNVTKRYGKVTALDKVSVDVRDNEFFVIFGPAGAGKTSVLNMIAGIGDPEEGEIYFDDACMNFVEPRERDVAMVFENYALYPHKSVYENIASSMRTKKYKQLDDIVDKEVKKVAAMLNISELLDRKPTQASNGQRQRIALGRALVRHPNVFLMDEPLAHLDAKLRNSMRKELKSMQEAFHTTTIYVTHDYTEAMSLGDRIAVINEGKMCQIGTANEVYYLPKTEFVAKLFGDCEINIVSGEIKERDGRLFLLLPYGDRLYEIPKDVEQALRARNCKTVDIGFRGWAMEHSRAAKDGYVKGSVYIHEPLGNKIELAVSVGTDILRFIVPIHDRFDIDETVYLDLVKSGTFINGQGRCERKESEGKYREYMRQSFSGGKLRIVLDCCDGAASELAPSVMESLGYDVIRLYCGSDGRFPNRNPNPADYSCLTDICRKVRETGADLGAAYDGDGDRVVFVDNKGRYLSSEKSFSIFIRDCLSREKGSLVYDQKSSSVVKDTILQAGGISVMERSGYGFIKQRFLDIHALAAGEISGHFFFRELGRDDGLYATLRMCRIIQESGKTLAEMADEIKDTLITPDYRMFCPYDRQDVILDEARKLGEAYPVSELDGVRIEFGNGWFLLRKSVTEQAGKQEAASLFLCPVFCYLEFAN